MVFVGPDHKGPRLFLWGGYVWGRCRLTGRYRSESHFQGCRICPRYIFGNYPPQMIPGSKYVWLLRYFFMFIPIWGRWTHFDFRIFFKWVGNQPPTSLNIGETRRWLWFKAKSTTWQPWFESPLFLTAWIFPKVDTFEGALNFFYDAVESFLLDYKVDPPWKGGFLCVVFP